MERGDLDHILLALANANRREIFEFVLSHPGCSVKDTAHEFLTISRVAVLKHLNILERAGLLACRKRGRTRHLFAILTPLKIIQDGWLVRFIGTASPQDNSAPVPLPETSAANELTFERDPTSAPPPHKPSL